MRNTLKTEIDLTHWNELAEVECSRLVDLALAEDLGGSGTNGFDCTTLAIVDPSMPGRAAFVARNEGIVCGLKPAQMVIDKFPADLQLEIIIPDGSRVVPSSQIAIVQGQAADILTSERTILNFMGRLSGISTLANRFVKEVQGTRAKILDTRKTTPAWRHLEKYAVVCGGAHNHRIGLYDAILIKDNHLAFAAAHSDNPIETAVSRARTWIASNAARLPHGVETIVQIEVDRIEQLQKALALPVDIILLDNMSIDLLKQAVKLRDATNRNIQLEASGGVNLNTVRQIAGTGVDRISAGALTHSAVNFDIGLDWL